MTRKIVLAHLSDVHLAPVVGFTQEVVALLAVPAGADPDRIVRDVVREVSGDGGGGRRSFATGVSRVVEDPEQIPEAYDQARRAVHVGRQLHGSGAVAHFDTLGTFRLLSLVRDPAENRRRVARPRPHFQDTVTGAECCRRRHQRHDVRL